ncbi:Arc family DNA-binding protein, partial [Salmonella enterica subsp. enterica serovar Cerro]|nr:Arc family DNA-binding protein [Salmonella enterica subsp. enterica serovar Cerro]
MIICHATWKDIRSPNRQMQDKFNLRFPDGMRDAIAERAKANGRSMNSEIVQILEDAL